MISSCIWNATTKITVAVKPKITAYLVLDQHISPTFFTASIINHSILSHIEMSWDTNSNHWPRNYFLYWKLRSFARQWSCLPWKEDKSDALILDRWSRRVLYTSWKWGLLNRKLLSSSWKDLDRYGSDELKNKCVAWLESEAPNPGMLGANIFSRATTNGVSMLWGVRIG